MINMSLLAANLEDLRAEKKRLDEAIQSLEILAAHNHQGQAGQQLAVVKPKKRGRPPGSKNKPTVPGSS